MQAHSPHPIKIIYIQFNKIIRDYIEEAGHLVSLDNMKSPDKHSYQNRKYNLLKSKFYKPRQTSDSIIRRKLCEKIILSNCSVALITAPAGFGKSVFMGQLYEYAIESKLNAIWLTIDSRDNDISRFLSYIYEAFSVLLSNTDISLFNNKNSGIKDYFSIQNEVISLIDAITSSDTPFIFFIDDLEAISNPEILNILQDLIESLQENQRIFIGTRSIHQLSLKKLELNGSLFKVGPDNLRFSLAETKDFIVERQGIDIDDEHVDIIHKKTQGWIAGLRLVALSLEGRRNCNDWIDRLSGQDTDIAEYLSENVLSQLPQTAREFLIRSSIFDTMNSDLCDFVLKRSDSHDILYSFEKSNLFITKIPSAWDDSLYAYRLHSLFRDFLLQELKKLDPEMVSVLHKRAAVRFKKKQRFSLAVEHALQSNDYRFAASMMNKCISYEIEVAQIDTVLRWLDAIPQEITNNYINIQRSRAFVMTSFHRYQDAEDALLNCRRLVKAKGATETQDEIIQFAWLHEFMDRHDLAIAEIKSISEDCKLQAPLLKVVAYNIIAYHHMALSQFDEAIAALSIAKKMNDSLPDSTSLAITYAHCFEGWISLIQGDADAALAKFEYSRELSEGIAHAISSVCLAQAYYEVDDRLGACSLINQRLKLIRDTADIDTIIIAYRLAARSAYHVGDMHSVEDLLSQLGDIGDIRGVSRPKAAAWLEKTRIRLLKGDFESAKRYLELGTKSDTWKSNSEFNLFANELENPATANIRLQLLTGQSREAIPLLEMLIDTATRKGRLMKRTHLQLLLAQALWASGNTETALDIFKSVLIFCQSSGFLRIIVDEPWYLQELIDHLDISDKSVSEIYFQRLKNSTKPLPYRTSALIETQSVQNPLTKRENTLILLVGDGRSNKEIANLLGISENTVESHLKKINQKLGTRKRTEAVKKAREMGIMG